jgi:hypothetical protein
MSLRKRALILWRPVRERSLNHILRGGLGLRVCSRESRSLIMDRLNRLAKAE